MASETGSQQPAANYTVGDLLERIQANIDTLHYDVAYQFCQKAQSLEPDNVAVLEVTATVALELGLFEEALTMLQRCVQLSPEDGYSKYMYLGQMFTGMDAVRYFEKGVTLMSRELEESGHNQHNGVSEERPDPAALKSQLATALCSMAEIYLTDCCFEPQAEANCEQYLTQATGMAPENPEVYQLLASVRLSQQRTSEAKDALLKSLALWQNKGVTDPDYPSYDVRIGTTKLLLELGLFDEALRILGELQKEDDQTVDLWYLYGWTYYCMAEDQAEVEGSQLNSVSTDAQPDGDRYRQTLADSVECLQTAVNLYRQLDYDDEGILSHAQELLQTIDQRIPLQTLLQDAKNDDLTEDFTMDPTQADTDDWEDIVNSDDNDMAMG
ncbi:hypothetical protein IWQ62_004546 [Dispira parvispora]|uniref:Tetratricopeptide repeat protein n=1 Tax=Dispira parvispora TaxID=1520584 RepID=A0A9W8AKL7_9FUNG|nr:hypothetical protein IWQ62_004546 [Dispira parvispora]